MTDKAYYPVSWSNAGGWTPVPMTLRRICDSSIIPTPEQRRRFEQSAAYLRFIYAVRRRSLLQRPGAATAATFPLPHTPWRRAPCHGCRAQDASAYEQRMRDKIQKRLEAQEEALKQLSAPLAPTPTADASSSSSSAATEAAAGTDPVQASPASSEATSASASAATAEQQAAAAAKQHRKAQHELQKLRSLQQARERQQREGQLRALAEVVGGGAGRRYLALAGQLERVEQEQRAAQARLALLRRKQALGGGGGDAKEEGQQQDAQEAEEVRQLDVHVVGLQRLAVSLRDQLKEAEAKLTGGADDGGGAGDSGGAAAAPAGESAAAAAATAAGRKQPHHKQRMAAAAAASAAGGAPGASWDPEQQELLHAVAVAKRRLTQVQSPYTALQQLIARAGEAGRQPHPDDERLAAELRDQVRARSRELTELEKRWREAKARAEAGAGAASEAATGEGSAGQAPA